MPSRVIQEEVHKLADDFQFLQSHLDQIEDKHTNKQLETHISEMKLGMKRAIKRCQKIQNLAALEANEQ